MPYDAKMILRGKYSSAYVNLDESDVAPTSLTVNSDGNVCIDLGVSGTGPKGLDCILILHDQPTTYADTLTASICDSDHLDGGWQTVMYYPVLYAYMRELVVTATVAFDASDDYGQVLTASGGGDTGVIREISRNLMTIGGVGKIWVEMADAGDTYATENDTLTSAVTGEATMIGTGRVIQTPRTMVRRFSTWKRYIRPTLTVSAGGDFGDVDMLVTDSQHSHVNNLYH